MTAQTTAGRPRSPRYEINPLYAAQYPHNPQNPPSAPYSEDIEDIERSYGGENAKSRSDAAEGEREPLVTPFARALDDDEWSEERAV